VDANIAGTHAQPVDVSTMAPSVSAPVVSGGDGRRAGVRDGEPRPHVGGDAELFHAAQPAAVLGPLRPGEDHPRVRPRA